MCTFLPKNIHGSANYIGKGHIETLKKCFWHCSHRTTSEMSRGLICILNLPYATCNQCAQEILLLPNYWLLEELRSVVKSDFCPCLQVSDWATTNNETQITSKLTKTWNKLTCVNANTMLPIYQRHVRMRISFGLGHVVDEPRLAACVRAINRECTIQSKYVVALSIFHKVPTRKEIRMNGIR